MRHVLLLLRHAKSSWGDPLLADRDRPLAGRGRKAAERMGEHIRSAGLLPDLVLCSTSVRTRETLARLRIDAPEVRFEDSMYGAPCDELCVLAHALPEAAGSVLLVGHNPGMADLATRLAGADRGDEAERLRDKYPTGALAVFEIDGPWSALARRSARLLSFTTPREL